VIHFAPLVWANLRRRRVRTILTILSVAVAFLLFGILAALRNALLGGADIAGADRLITTHKTSIIQSLPRSYLNRIAGTDGVLVATSFNWMGTYYKEERNQVFTYPSDPNTLNEVYPEFTAPPDQMRTFRSTRDCALVGESAAITNKWKVGDRIPIRSSIFRKQDGGDTWDLTVCGIYSVKEGAGDTSGVYIHYEYFNEALRYGRDQAGWIVFRVRDPARMTEIARRVDAMFANSATETKTASERAFAQGWVNQIGNVGAIISAVVSAVFFTMLLVTANTMAQAVRERTNELAVLKTLGFTGRQVLWMVLAESVLITVLGGVVGMILATVFVSGAKQAVAQYLPLLAIPSSTWLVAIAFMAALGITSGAMPAWQAWRLNIVTALRRG
jgi:putative ABC transport system permease protein